MTFIDRWRMRRTQPPIQRPVALRREDALLDWMVELDERRMLPCLDCEIGEPHVCERAWWQQQYDHDRGAPCADRECVPCYPPTCDCCGQPVTWLRGEVAATGGGQDG